MPRSKSSKKPEAEYTLISVKVERHEARARAGINHNAITPQYAWNLVDDDPLYEFTTELSIFGVVASPKGRMGDSFELTIYEADAGWRRLDRTLKDVPVRDQYGAPKYRQYRGKQVPVYDPPNGIGMIDKVRGEQRWTGWFAASPQFITNYLTLLGQNRDLFLGIYERKEARRRRLSRVTLQTSDPKED